MLKFPRLQEYFEDDDVLFSDHPWVILSTDKMAGYMNQTAVIGHKCSEFEIVQFMDEEDSIRGECWWCKTGIPDHIQGLWKMMNWEKLPNMREYETDESEKETHSVHGDGRKRPTMHTSVSLATASIHKTQTIVGRDNGR